MSEILSASITAAALAMDAFSVSLGAGACRRFMAKREVMSLSLAFGFFQFAMPLGGWFLESSFACFISAWDHWIASGILGFIGIKAIWGSFIRKDECVYLDISRPSVLFILAVATSIDALAAGFSMAAVRSPVLLMAVLAGIITAVLSALGAMAGCRIGQALGCRAEFAGGVILLIIGLNILGQALNWF